MAVAVTAAKAVAGAVVDSPDDLLLLAQVPNDCTERKGGEGIRQAVEGTEPKRNHITLCSICMPLR